MWWAILSMALLWTDAKTIEPLSNSELALAAAPGLLDGTRILDLDAPESIISKMLTPRPVGSSALKGLQDELVSLFTDLGWDVEEDKFKSETVAGEKTFRNLIFTHDAAAAQRLVFSAHLDSKLQIAHEPEGSFIGATDSAAPCAMLVDLAVSLTHSLDRRKAQGLGHETLQIIFFDGEEAFHDWSDTDSIYGARHLAEKWKNDAGKGRFAVSGTHNSNTLDRISNFVLLDLLGSARPSIPSYFGDTDWFHALFFRVQNALGNQGLLWPSLQDSSYVAAAGDSTRKEHSFFMQSSQMRYSIGDDHAPFAANGVPVLHVIPIPFPEVWHTMRDDRDALDQDTVNAWGALVKSACAEYLQLGRFLSGKQRDLHDL